MAFAKRTELSKLYKLDKLSQLGVSEKSMWLRETRQQRHSTLDQYLPP